MLQSNPLLRHTVYIKIWQCLLTNPTIIRTGYVILYKGAEHYLGNLGRSLECWMHALSDMSTLAFRHCA